MKSDTFLPAFSSHDALRHSFGLQTNDSIGNNQIDFKKIFEAHLEQINIPERFNLEEMQNLFERLYLGPPQQVELVLSEGSLNEINKIFDSIIRKHGIRAVQFEFKIK